MIVRDLKKSDFEASDKHGFPGIGEFVINTISSYDQRSKVESFVYLHGAIEVLMFNVWGLYLMSILKKEFKPLSDFWDFKTSMILLEQVNLLDESTRSKLLSFKKGRDNVSHLMTNKFHKRQIKEKTLDDQFKKGISAYKDIIKIRKNLVKQIKKM